MSITWHTSRLFFETPELHAELVRIVAMYCTHVVKWEGNRWLKTSAVLHLLLQACYYMQNIWRHPGPVPMDQRQRYASMVTQFTKAWGALGWSVPVWVHWLVCHSGAHLQRWGNFIKFSSIPTEWRNKSCKMDIRHCFQGSKLSKPYVTRWGLRHALHLDALVWGIRGCGLGKRVWVERGSSLACNACGRSIVHVSTCRYISCDVQYG